MALKYRIMMGGLIALLLAAVTVAIFGKPALAIKVREFPIAGEINRHYYLATLGDWTFKSITLDAVTNADARSGGGTFFPCEIAVRDQASGRWSTVSQGSLHEVGKTEPERTVTVIPFERTTTCDIVLPHDGEGPIDCVRITLYAHWQSHFDQRDEIASRVIPVPYANPNGTAPCTN